MFFAEALGRQQDAVFRRLGEDAVWNGGPGTVRVRVKERDDDVGFGEGQTVVTRRFLTVRRSEVPNPVAGDVATRRNGDGLRVIGTPRIDAKGRWVCEVEPVEA